MGCYFKARVRGNIGCQLMSTPTPPLNSCDRWMEQSRERRKTELEGGEEGGRPTAPICIKFQVARGACAARSGFCLGANELTERERRSQIRKCLRGSFWQRRSFATMDARFASRVVVLYFQFSTKKKSRSRAHGGGIVHDSTLRGTAPTVQKTTKIGQGCECHRGTKGGGGREAADGDSGVFPLSPLESSHYNSLRVQRGRPRSLSRRRVDGRVGPDKAVPFVRHSGVATPSPSL